MATDATMLKPFSNIALPVEETTGLTDSPEITSEAEHFLFIRARSEQNSIQSDGNVILVEFGENDTRGRRQGIGLYTIDTSYSDYEPKVDFQDLQNFFDEIVDREYVEQFCSKYPDLMPFLLDAHAALRKIFLTEPLSLEYAEDPNNDEGTGLSLLVTVFRTAKDELPRLRQFDRDWWRSNRHQSLHKITVDLQYR
jgi:hypothetical protein